ncbi:MAG TPA: NADH-quinone oxidoreductase subunit C [Lacunisphaera sp.]|nr:NADH-quinone oxidoreductase subunit C [Lacunisphaera sp.]
MDTVEQLRDRLIARFPAARVEVVTNPGPAAEHSLLLDAAHAHDIALFLRDDSTLRLDYCSNVTGVDWPDKEVVDVTKTTVPDPASGQPKIIEQKTKRLQPGCLEAVYHLYSIALKHGPVVIRLRTANRTDQVELPSLTPIWRSCDFQEREIFDLYGIIFTRHPDLRRLLMWDGFRDHPMRKDYVEPDDYEWEPTAHGAVLDKYKTHLAPPAAKPADGSSVASAKEGAP